MQGPVGGDRLWDEDELHEFEEDAQAFANAQDKGKDEGGVVYGYVYTMQGTTYVWYQEDLKFWTNDEIAQLEQNGQIGKVYIAYKE